MAATYAREFVGALQAQDESSYLQLVSTPKHFVCNDFEKSTFDGRTLDRHNYTANVTLQELVEYYFVPFKAAVQEGGAQAIMCSCKTDCRSFPCERVSSTFVWIASFHERFSTCMTFVRLMPCRALDNSVSIDGAEAIPSCAHPVLKNHIVRGEWGFRGSFVSDCGAIADEGPDARRNGGIGVHHWCRGTNQSDEYETCVAESLRSGCDVECYDDNFGCIFSEYGPSALAHGKITPHDIDLAFGRVARAMLRLGMLDTDKTNVYSGLGISDVDTESSRALSLEAAYQAMVLLKNAPIADHPLLPLDDKMKLAIIGPHSNCTQDFLSDYHGVNTLVNTHSPIDELRQRGVSYVVAPGLNAIEDNETAGFAEAVSAAQSADVAIIFAGLHQRQEGEGHDRKALTLPGAQHALIQAVHAVNQRTVLVLINGGPLAIEWEAEHIPAILESFYGGQLAAPAIIGTLFGDHNPSGRLPGGEPPQRKTLRSSCCCTLAPTSNLWLHVFCLQ